MKLDGAIKRIEKAHGKLNQNENGQYYLTTDNNKTISFYEHNQNTGLVYTFYVNHVGSDTGYNGYNGIFCETLKFALQWLAQD